MLPIGEKSWQDVKKTICNGSRTLGQTLLSLILKSYSILQRCIACCPDSGVKWITPDYQLVEDLLEDLTTGTSAIKLNLV